jgi:3-hydroxyisobutyrate dehydrogenase-like beta-hydroxyacid dehydrogenase
MIGFVRLRAARRKEARAIRENRMKIGFIGVGSIGRPMAGRLRSAGHELVVFDTNATALEAFVKEGGQRASSPRDVADKVEIILYSLPTPEVVRSVTLGRDGVIHGNRARLIVDMSTTGPAVAMEVARDALRHGKQMLEAPVSGGIAGAAEGRVAIMASGPRAAFEEVKPLLEAVGKVFFVGEGVGQGQTMKLLNNILSAAAIAATTEAVVLGVKAGLDPAVMIDVFNAGGGQSKATSDKFPRSVLNRTFNYGFRTDLLLKDIRLLKDFADQMDVKLRVGETVIKVWELAEPEFAQSDYTNLVKVIEREAGVIVGKEKLA